MARLLIIAVLAAGALTLAVIAYNMIEATRANMLHTFHQDEAADSEAASASLATGYGPHRTCTISQKGEAWTKSCIDTETP